MSIVRWEITTTRKPSSNPDRWKSQDADALNVLLDEGWEPFAATEGGPMTGVLYHLRRQIGGD